MALSLHTEAWSTGGTIPKRFTADGEDRSPPLGFRGVPAGTQAFALICDDPDAPVGTWVHWVIFNIPGSATGLPEGVPASERLPDGTCQGTNSWKRIGYGGPSPPPGAPHRYFFRLYALPGPLGLGPGAGAADVEAAARSRSLGQAEYLGRYGREKPSHR